MHPWFGVEGHKRLSLAKNNFPCPWYLCRNWKSVNYSSLLSSALETHLDLVLPQDQDPEVVCTEFADSLLKTVLGGYSS